MWYRLKKNVRIGIVFILIFIVLLIVYFLFFYHTLTIKLNGNSQVNVAVFSNYKDDGASAFYDGVDVSKYIKSSSINTEKVGKYNVIYNIKYKGLIRKTKRVVSVVDKEKPKLIINGDNNVTIRVGKKFNNDISAIDNYDGDITSKIKINGNVDNKKVGKYNVTYSVSDSSGNKSSLKRVVEVVDKVDMNQGIAVLNYHFFYDSSKGEVCNDGNCEDIVEFRKQLDYLKDNNFKTLTMKEYRDWMYGDIELPEKSVLITIDDGALGTGIHNGNKLIPILEEYKMHATLFLITGWWSIDNYKSDYLDIESHTNDMHKERVCDGVTRGAQMLCMSDDAVRKDLLKSINITKSKYAFCFPFYAYDEAKINVVKNVGFELAFIGGGRMSKRTDDKWHIPRYQIKKSTSIDTFIKYVNQ